MSKTGKPYERRLHPDLAAEILNLPFEDPSQSLPPARTIGEHVRRATAAVEAANTMLASSNVVQIIAKSLMRDLKKRGVASLFVTPDGSVMLRIAYDSAGVPEKDTPVPLVRPGSNPGLPKLAVLRQQAKELGLNISDLGRQRRAIFDLIQETRAKLKAGVDEVKVSSTPSVTLRKGTPDNGAGKTLTLVAESVATLPATEMSVDELLGQVE